MEQTSFARVISATLLASAIVFFGWWGGNAYRDAHLPSRSISVTGSADRTVSSDMAKWSFSFSRSTDELGLRQGNVALAGDLGKIKTYLLQEGLKEGEISVQVPIMTMICEMQNGQSGVGYNGGGQYCTTKTLGYNFSQTIVVETKNIDVLTKVAHDAMRVLGDRDILIAGGSVEYYLQSLPAIKLDMLAEATKNAEARAEKIASSTGARIGRVQSANMGVFQVTTVNSTDISDYGTYDTTSIQKKVTAIVRTDFLLE